MKRLTLALALPVLAGCGESQDLPGMNGLIACRDNGGFERKLELESVQAMVTTKPAVYLCTDGTVRWAKH
ncbi:MAG: hypothetical protein ACMV0I_07340 [Pseudomonas sp.]